jgi:CelD/BcsL family acetyltransferase involved in cellulose biosynthesis
MGFHGRLQERHASSVDLTRVSVGGETIGALYNFVSGDRVYNYQSGFRYESDNQLVPGFVTHLLAAERYREDGFAIYDMMGGEAEYKRRLGAEGETLKTVALTRRGWRSSLRGLLKLLRPSHAAKTRQT